MAYYSGFTLNVEGQVSCLPHLVDLVGFEPTTFSMPLRRAPRLRYRPKLACGPGGIRTPDLLSAIEARSQLRYRPNEANEIVPDSMRCVKQPQTGQRKS
jgi:hypothetical protein